MKLLGGIYRWFSCEGNFSVKRATTLLAVTALLSNALGLIRNMVYYRLIPRGSLDVYFSSFRLPDLLFNVLILGAVSSAFIPVIQELRAKEKEGDKTAVWQVSDQSLSWLTVVFGLVAVVMVILMRPIMQQIVPGFAPERLNEAVLVSRILMLQSIFFAWSFTIGGLLNSLNRFTSYAFAPLVYNISLIVGGFLASKYGIIALAWSVVLGAFFHFYIQFSEVIKLGYRPRFDLSRSPEIKKILSLMLPRSLTLGTSQIVLIVYTALGSGLIDGSIGIFTGMNDLQTTPTVIVANSLAVAFFPTLTLLIARDDREGISNLVSKVVRTALFLLIPSVSLAIILRAQIVRLYYGISGASWSLTNLAIDTFVWFLVGIIPASLVMIMARIYYANKDTRTPLIFSTIAGVIGIMTAWIGIRVAHGSVPVLAMAVSTVSWVQCALYLYHLQQQEHVDLHISPLMSRIFSYLVGSAVMGAAAWLTLHTIDLIYVRTGILSTRLVLGLFIQMILSGAVGIAVYIAYSRVVKQEELPWLLKNAFTKK